MSTKTPPTNEQPHAETGLPFSKFSKAAEQMDWQQVVLNGGPPCFHLCEDDRFCGRAEAWPGHNSIHEYVPLVRLITTILLGKLVCAENDASPPKAPTPMWYTGRHETIRAAIDAARQK